MEDFNIPSEERVALLERLQEAIGGAPLYFWAACQICDIRTLENLIEHARISPAIVRILAERTRTMVLYWTQSSKGSSKPTTPRKPILSDLGSSPASSASSAKKQKTSDSPGSKLVSSPTLFRNQAAKTLAEQRDSFRCVLTGNGGYELAHIYLFYSLKNKEDDIFGPRHIFWDHLKIFWPEEKVATWEAELFPEGIDGIGIERVYNLITLSRDAHIFWNRGAFALKPISVDNNNTTLKVQFFWQKKQKDTQVTMSLLATPFSTEDLDQNKGAFEFSNARLTNIRGPQPCYIKSGDIFELKTNDAEARPLPSFALLEMQWFLTRVVGMAGAAVPYKAGWGNEDSDEEISNLGLSEVEDDSLIFADPILPNTPQFLRKDNLLSTKGSKHHIEEVEGDGVRAGAGDGVRAGDQDRVQVIT